MSKSLLLLHCILPTLAIVRHPNVSTLENQPPSCPRRICAQQLLLYLAAPCGHKPLRGPMPNVRFHVHHGKRLHGVLAHIPCQQQCQAHFIPKRRHPRGLKEPSLHSLLHRSFACFAGFSGPFRGQFRGTVQGTFQWVKSQDDGAGVVRGGLVHLPVPVASGKKNTEKQSIGMLAVSFHGVWSVVRVSANRQMRGG